MGLRARPQADYGGVEAGHSPGDVEQALADGVGFQAGAQHLAGLVQRQERVKAALELLVQMGALDHGRELGRQKLQQVQIVVVEASRPPGALEGEHADWLVARRDERQADRGGDRSGGAAPPRAQVLAGAFQHERLPRSQHLPGDAVLQVRDGGARRNRIDADGRTHGERPVRSGEQQHAAAVVAAEGGSALERQAQHRIEAPSGHEVFAQLDQQPKAGRAVARRLVEAAQLARVDQRLIQYLGLVVEPV